MKRHRIGILRIDTLDYIYFAMVRPIWTHKPKSWPCATHATGHMGKVEYHQSVVVELLTRNPYAVATRPCCHIGGINTHIHDFITGINETVTSGSPLIDILHITGRGI